MRFRQRRTSQNVEDRRGQPRGRAGGPVSSRTVGAGAGGCGLLVVVILFVAMGLDPTPLLEGQLPQDAPPAQIQAPAPEAEGEFSEAEQAHAEFASQVLADTESVWARIFEEEGFPAYVEPTLVLYSGSVSSACGFGQSAMGPFYCPGDNRIYLDLSFFDELDRRFGAPGDFADAYVVAHEVAHHVQNLRDITRQVQEARMRLSEKQGNRYSVMLELMADCYAGVWAHRATQDNLVLDEEDIREGLRAASAIGDDTLQKRSQGYVVPDAFTHGSAEQRMDWFMRGLRTGDIASCDTFGEMQ